MRYAASPPPGPGAPGNPGAPGTPGTPGIPGQPAGGVTHCPRHPDRAAYARCQRCNRPACHECQRPATVGFHCVDCASSAAASAPKVRTAAGAVQRKRGLPIVTVTIMAVCVVLEVLRYLAFPLWQQIAANLIFVPAWGLVEPYRFFTSTLLHSGIWHLAFNMYALWLIGQQLEFLLGRARFFALYFLSAVGGSVAYLAIAGVDAAGVVGASGGVFGLFGAYAVFMRRLGHDPRPILTVIAINVVLGFVISNIAWQAHLGGLVVGALVATVFARIPVRRVPKPTTTMSAPPGTAVARQGVSGVTLQWLACGGILLALAAIVWVVYALA